MRSVASEFPHVLFHSILILVEIPDKVLDVIIYYMYSKGEIISHPSDNVTAALFAFVGIGFAISVARKLLCGHRIAQIPFLVFGFHLYYYCACYDCGKRYRYDKEPNLLMMFAMIATLLLSLGCVIATIHLIMDFNKFCQPPLGE